MVTVWASWWIWQIVESTSEGARNGDQILVIVGDWNNQVANMSSATDYLTSEQLPAGSKWLGVENPSSIDAPAVLDKVVAYVVAQRSFGWLAGSSVRYVLGLCLAGINEHGLYSQPLGCLVIQAHSEQASQVRMYELEMGTPTATQEVAEVHETPSRNAPVSPDGTGRMAGVHVVPERVSMPGTWLTLLL